MDLDNAIQAHAEWKVKLRAAIAKKEKMDAAKLGRDDNCSLGQWLHGEGKGAYGRLASYSRCVEEHAKFHRCAGEVARTINAGKLTQAEAMLATGTPYAGASSAVAMAVMALKKEAAL